MNIEHTQQEKLTRLAGAVIQKQASAKEFIDDFVSASDVEKDNCAYAMKHISASNPEIVAPHIDTLLEYINHRLPRARWGVPEAIGNLKDTARKGKGEMARQELTAPMATPGAGQTPSGARPNGPLWDGPFRGGSAG